MERREMSGILHGRTGKGSQVTNKAGDLPPTPGYHPGGGSALFGIGHRYLGASFGMEHSCLHAYVGDGDMDNWLHRICNALVG